MSKSQWIIDAVSKIEAFKGMKHEKSIFKGTGTRSPNFRAINMAKDALKVLDEIQLQPDEITTAPDGGVVFRWSGDNKTGTVDFYNTTECFGTVIDEKGFREVWEVAPHPEALKKTLKHIREFVGKSQAA